MSLNKPQNLIVLLAWCLFMGVTAISIGVGAIFPALNQIAGPFVCPNGEMRVDAQTYRPSPGTTVTTLDWQCVDKKSGEAQRINEWSMFLINGLIYGTILFVLVLIGYWIRAKRRARRVQQQAAIDVPTTYTASMDLPQVVKFDSLEGYELQELTRMHKEGQFSEAEYLRKRNKILNRMASQSAPETSVDDPLVEDLRKLKKMLDEGLITEVDYEQKKAGILSRL